MLSLATVDAAIGKHYYAQDNYYTWDEAQGNSAWFGKGAAALGLKGKVDADLFNAILEGKLPGQVEKMVHDNPSKKHRGGLDLTFSAPKSVSIAALINGDERLIHAHRAAVNAALEVAEKRYAHTRVGSNQARSIQSSGNFVVAKFHHDVSRALDPQLHTHCVVINAIKRKDDKWRSHHTDAVFRHSKFLGLVYQNELAKGARKIGYETIIHENGTFDLKDIDQDLLQTFSKRRRQILALGGSDQKANRDLVLIDRPKKKEELSLQALQTVWKKEIGHAQALPPIPKSISAVEAGTLDLSSSFKHATAHDVSFEREKSESFILQGALGSVCMKEMDESFAQALRQREIIPTIHRQFTTETAIKTEQDIIAMLHAGMRKSSNHEKQDIELSPELSVGQRGAVLQSLQSSDQFLAWQGVAGAGKTFALKFTKKGLEAAGYQLRGFAPSAEAAKVLQTETGIATTTIAAKLFDQKSGSPGEFWIVDEAGLMAANDCKQLMGRAQQQNARILFIGDTKQLSSVGAGNPFKLLQQNQISTAFLNESRRQKTATLKAAVAHFSQLDMEKGLNLLTDKCVMQEDDNKRIKQIAKEYTAMSPTRRQKCLVLAGRKDQREWITQEIRRNLIKSGEIAVGEAIEILTPKDLTKEQIQAGLGIEKGDYVQIQKNLGPLKRSEAFEICSIDREKRLVTIQKGDMKREIGLKTCCSIFQHSQIKISGGEKLRWTKNQPESGLRNGQDLTLVGRSKEELRLKDQNGREYLLPANRALFLDYNYINTVYASQGKTADQALIFTDNAMGKEALYVAVSRARTDVKLFCKNSNELEKIAGISRAKQSAVELRNQFLSHSDLRWRHT